MESLFEQDWWLDTVAPQGWKRIQVLRGDHVVAQWNYVITQKFKSSVIGMPPYTPYSGPWILSTDAKQTQKLEREKQIIQELLAQIPQKPKYVLLSLAPSITYFLPFIWGGFKLNPRLTYRLKLDSPTTAIFENFKDNIKREIRKAEKILNVENCSVEDLCSLQYNGGKKSLALLQSIVKNCQVHDCCKLIAAKDEQGIIYAASLFVYDSSFVYYLCGHYHKNHRTSGASSLLMWEGIKFAQSKGLGFDFEGSVIENIERFFRGFGGIPTTYYQIERRPFRIRLIEFFSNLIRK